MVTEIRSDRGWRSWDVRTGISMRAFLLPLIAALVIDVPLFAAGDQNDYFPLGEGCEWTMNARIVSRNGEVKNATAHRKNEGRVERGGKNYFRERTWMDGGESPMEYVQLTRKDDTGVYTLAEGQGDAPEQKDIPLPLKIGASWQRRAYGVLHEARIIAIESVTIDGKVYENCYHFKTVATDGSVTEDYWEAPQVGSVKSEMVYGNGFKITLTLKEFKRPK